MRTAILEAKLGRRLQHPDGAVRIEGADSILDRVSRSLAEAERRYSGDDAAVRTWTRRFRALMEENRFWPSGRVLNNCGTRQGQLASCFVLPLPDDFGKIFDSLAVAAACHRTGGGTGFDLSELREAGAPISGAESAGASGPVSFLHLFDMETAVTMQGGKMRGANLASLSVRHPDVLAFIDAKASVGTLPNFNLSVAVDDAFMHALSEGGSVDLASPRDGRVVRRVPASEIWERMASSAWRTGDPGVLFPDAINRANPLAGHLGPIRTTNPCGEQTLYPYEASNLGSINLAAFVGADGFDWAWFEQTVAEATRLLDDAIDVTTFPDPRITAMAVANRRLGLGVMGFADVLVRLRLPYDSPRALDLVDELGGRLRSVASATSRQLAAERGAYPNWRHAGQQVPVRNCAVTTIAPTGTISMVAGCSSGIEPRFAPVWNKDVLAPDGLDQFDDDLVDEVSRAVGVGVTDARGMLRSRPLADLPVRSLDHYRYAFDISPAWHVRVAAQWQRHIDNAVSKTVNLPADATEADAAQVFRLSWELGCKGTSLYRQGSRDRDLLEVRGAVSRPEGQRQSKSLMAGLEDSVESWET